MGLDNAGKTSIVLSLKGHTNLMEFRGVEPTKKIEINEVLMENKKWIIWDFGGQKRYRDEYLEELRNKNRNYFQNTDKIMYVIDVRDKKRYGVALDYLDSIVRLLEDQDRVLDFSVFLHKYDPGIEEINEFKTPVIQEELVKKIKDIIPPNFVKKFFKTSIYTVFSKAFFKSPSES